MAKLTDLSNELLLLIFDDLSNRDIKSLSLVATRLSAICQRALLHSVYITNPRRQLPSLIRILVQRPDLRPCLRNFNTTASLSSVARVADWSSLITEAKKSATALGFKRPPWYIALQSGFVPACIGLVLVLATQLEGLELKHNDDLSITLECMFARPVFKKMRLTSFPFLNTLERLELSITEVDGRWFNLPKLHTLTVDCLPRYLQSTVQLDQRPGRTLENLVLKCLTRVFYTSYEWEEVSHSSLLSHFPDVKHVQIAYTNYKRKKDRKGNWGWYQYLGGYEGHCDSFTHLVKRLDPLSPSIESLEFVSLDHAERDFTPHLLPFDTLRHFSKLKCLRVPYTALLNTEKPFQRPRLNPVQVLPASLETLIIDGPRPETMAWLSLLLGYRRELPELSEVILDFLDDPSNELSAFECSEEYPMVSFEGAGIQIRCRNVNEETSPINQLGNYMFGPYEMEG